jgi:hypothetical protein
VAGYSEKVLAQVVPGCSPVHTINNYSPDKIPLNLAAAVAGQLIGGSANGWEGRTRDKSS